MIESIESPNAEAAQVIWTPGEGAFGYRSALGLDGLPGVTAELVAESDDDLPEITIRISGSVLEVRSQGTSRPYQLEFRVKARNGTSVWRPGSSAPHNVYPPSWANPQRSSPLNGVPLCALLAGPDVAAATVVVDDGGHGVSWRAGAVEETAELFVSVSPAISNAPLAVRIDSADAPFVRAVGDATDWMFGGSVAPSSKERSRSALPVYCTWYSMHLGVSAERVLHQAEMAADLGFGTVIIDDGWQTSETGRGYGTAGDWAISRYKFPDPKQFVERLHARGLAVVWWIGTPFIGDRAAARRVGAHPVTNHDDALQAWTADIRSLSARQALHDRIVSVLTEAGGDGLKIDFLEVFARDPDTVAPADSDSDSLEEAALLLIAAVERDVRSLIDDPLIEYREPYVSPRALTTSTMVRVSDAPLSHVENRVGIVDLRLSTRGPYVHSDPLMWGPNDSDSVVGRALVNALFGIPQVSVDLAALSQEHTDVLKFWMQQWRMWSTTLLHGTFTAARPDLSYPVIRAASDGIAIIGRYGPVPVDVDSADSVVQVANADDNRVLIRGLDLHNSAARIDIRDARGRRKESFRLDRPGRVEEFDVPTGGLLTISRHKDAD